MTDEELEWLSVNWDNDGELFRQWILGSHHAFKLVRWMIDNYQRMKQEVVSLEDEILFCPAINYHEPEIQWCTFHNSPKDTDEMRFHDNRCLASINSRECVFEWRKA